ncbi:hypothetical protein PR048_004756 [Dryococelus australis]|uniref:Uncharacterized protein n=1 Tax=Dryococelus australis TaxID=614101 RepID=A0ABQ9I738_9NEOP|nr:hypothetical protein PR048_004756 [Dryococelus australis]
MYSAENVIPDMEITSQCLYLEEQIHKNPSSEVTYSHSTLNCHVFIAGRQLIRKLTRSTQIAAQKYAKNVSQKLQVFGVCVHRGVSKKGGGGEAKEIVLNHITDECDLIATDALYHKNRDERFSIVGSSMPGEPSENVVVRPVDQPKLEAFNKSCNFLDGNDGCQYLLSDLMEMTLKFGTESDKLYS